MARAAYIVAALSVFTARAAYTCPNVTVVSNSPFNVINASTPGAQGNKYGIEDGRVVRTADGRFHLVVAEMIGDPKWVQMQLGAWSSADGYTWVRDTTLRVSSGNFNGTDPRAALWGPSYVWDDDQQKWALLYVSYYCAPSNSSGWYKNYFGQIWLAYSAVSGDAGISGPFIGDNIILSPVPGPYTPWQGLQGTDSFFAYKRYDTPWMAFYGSAHMELPNNFADEWVVSLAAAPSLSGDWVRQPEGAPVIVNITNGYTENPMVQTIPGNIVSDYFLVVFDYLNNEANGFGVSCSTDGVNWLPGKLVPLPGGARTPFGLVPFSAADVQTHAGMLEAAGVDVDEARNNAMLLEERAALQKSRAANATLPTVLTALYWAFYSVQDGDWEVMRTAVFLLTFSSH